MKYAYYPGCAGKGATPELHQSTMKVVEGLGIDVHELTAFNCCGAGVLGEADPDLAYIMNARTLATAESLGLDIMTVCGTCQGVLGGANKKLQKDKVLRERINQALKSSTGLEYQGTIKVKHLQWILVKDYGIELLKKHVSNPLTDVSIAPFYGCYILRPDSATGFDDWENPQSLEKLINALGAYPVAYDDRTKCCGFPVFLEKEEISTGMVEKRIGSAKKAGGDAMVTPCPLCHMGLDIKQDNANDVHAQKEGSGKKLDMPILHLPQLIGLAMGFSPKSLGMKHHLAPTASFIQKIG